MRAPEVTGVGVVARMRTGPAPRHGSPDRSQFDPLAARERGPRESGLRESGQRRAAHCTRGRNAGFTYIGLLILVAVMSISMTVVAEVWQITQQRDKEEELLFIGNEFRRALAAYVAVTNSHPKSLEDLVKDPGFPGVRRYLRKIYRDPITGSTEWGLVKPDGNYITGVYSLSEEQPLKQGGFNVANQKFEGKKKYSEWLFVPGGAQGPAGAAPADAGQSNSGSAPRVRR